MFYLCVFVEILSEAVTLHFKMFSADADVLLARRIRRDTNEKGRDIGAVLDQVATFYRTICVTSFDYFLILFHLAIFTSMHGFRNITFSFMLLVGYCANSLI